MKTKDVTIEELGNEYIVVSESGQVIEDNFRSYSIAEKWTKQNGYNVVILFFTIKSR